MRCPSPPCWTRPSARGGPRCNGSAAAPAHSAQHSGPHSRSPAPGPGSPSGPGGQRSSWGSGRGPAHPGTCRTPQMWAVGTWRTQLKPKLGCMSSTSWSRSSRVWISPWKRSRRSMYCTCVGAVQGAGPPHRPPQRREAYLPSQPRQCRHAVWLGAPGPGSQRLWAGSQTPGRAPAAGPGSLQGTARPPGRRGFLEGQGPQPRPSSQPWCSRAHLLEAALEGLVFQHTQCPDILRRQQVVEGAEPLAQLHIEAPVADGPGHEGISCPLVTCRHHLQVPWATLTTGIEGRAGWVGASSGSQHPPPGHSPPPHCRQAWLGPRMQDKPLPPLAGRCLCTTSSPAKSEGQSSETCRQRPPSAPLRLSVPHTTVPSPPLPASAPTVCT